MHRLGTDERRARLVVRHRLAPEARSADPLDIAQSLVCLHSTDAVTVFLAIQARSDGLSPTDVLTWATRNAGQLLVDPPDRVGVIEPGALADLIVVDGDPLTDLTLLARPEESLRAVIRDGSFAINRLPRTPGGST